MQVRRQRAAATVPVVLVEIQSGLRRLRRSGPGQRQRSPVGAGVRDVTVVRPDGLRDGRTGPRLSAGHQGQRSDPNVTAELQVRQIRAEQRGESTESGRYDGRHRQLRARPDHQQQRVPVAVELQRVQEVRVHVHQQRRVSRSPRRPTVGRRRPHIRGRFRLPERFSRRLCGHLLRRQCGRVRQDADEHCRTVHVQGHKSVRPRREFFRHR